MCGFFARTLIFLMDNYCMYSFHAGILLEAVVVEYVTELIENVIARSSELVNCLVRCSKCR